MLRWTKAFEIGTAPDLVHLQAKFTRVAGRFASRSIVKNAPVRAAAAHSLS